MLCIGRATYSFCILPWWHRSEWAFLEPSLQSCHCSHLLLLGYSTSPGISAAIDHRSDRRNRHKLYCDADVFPQFYVLHAPTRGTQGGLLCYSWLIYEEVADAPKCGW